MCCGSKRERQTNLSTLFLRYLGVKTKKKRFSLPVSPLTLLIETIVRFTAGTHAYTHIKINSVDIDDEGKRSRPYVLPFQRYYRYTTTLPDLFVLPSMQMKNRFVRSALVALTTL